MTRLSGLVLMFLVTAGGLAGAADNASQAIIDKAIQAQGGEEKLSALKAATWKTKGTIYFGGNPGPVKLQATVQGLDHFRQEFEGEFMGNQVKGLAVVAGDKGWRKFADMKMELEKETVGNEKRSIYLSMVAIAPTYLKSKDFKIEAASDDKLDGKPVVVVQAKGPDGKDFRMYFDKETGLPVKQVGKVHGFTGEEVEQEVMFRDYKDFNGIKKATRIDVKRGGEKYLEGEVTEFKVLEQVDPKTFAEPD